jgi:hypothetical protein
MRLEAEPLTVPPSSIRQRPTHQPSNSKPATASQQQQASNSKPATASQQQRAKQQQASNSKQATASKQQQASNSKQATASKQQQASFLFPHLPADPEAVQRLGKYEEAQVRHRGSD